MDDIHSQDFRCEIHDAVGNLYSREKHDWAGCPLCLADNVRKARDEIEKQKHDLQQAGKWLAESGETQRKLSAEIEQLQKHLELWRKVATAARGFIKSHVADPDITDEMILHHNAYLAAEKRLEEHYESTKDCGCGPDMLCCKNRASADWRCGCECHDAQMARYPESEQSGKRMCECPSCGWTGELGGNSDLCPDCLSTRVMDL